MPEVQPGGDRRDHPGGAEPLGREEGGVGRQERDRHLHRRVFDADSNLCDHPPDGHTDDTTAHEGDRERRDRRGRRERAAGGRGDGDAVDRQRRRVVQQTLAFEDRHDLPRQSEPRRDRGGGDRVRRRDDGAQRDRDGPRKAGNERVGDHGNRQRRREDQADRERADGAEVGAQAPHRREVRGDIEERRQDDEEDEVRLDRDPRDPRHQAQQETADDQKDRVRDPDAARDRDERGHRDEEGEDQLGGVHATARGAGGLAVEAAAAFFARPETDHVALEVGLGRVREIGAAVRELAVVDELDLATLDREFHPQLG